MSFLNENQQEEVANLLLGEEVNNSDKEVEQPQSFQQEETEQPVVEATAEQQDDNEAVSSPANEDDKHIPYSRFRSVIQSRNELKNQLNELESQLAQLQEQQKSSSQPQKQEQTVWEQYEDQDDAYDNWEDPVDQRLQQFEQRFQKYEVERAEVQLEREIANVQQAFPDVGQEVLLNAVIHNPDADLFQVAETYTQFVSGVRERAIAEYLESNPQSAPAPVKAAPPRVSPAAAGSSVARGVGETTPKNLNGARNALFEYLEQNWKR
jgi:chromosome segregation ATPase